MFHLRSLFIHFKQQSLKTVDETSKLGQNKNQKIGIGLRQASWGTLCSPPISYRTSWGATCEKSVPSEALTHISFVLFILSFFSTEAPTYFESCLDQLQQCTTPSTIWFEAKSQDSIDNLVMFRDPHYRKRWNGSVSILLPVSPRSAKQTVSNRHEGIPHKIVQQPHQQKQIRQQLLKCHPHPLPRPVVVHYIAIAIMSMVNTSATSSSDKQV